MYFPPPLFSTTFAPADTFFLLRNDVLVYLGGTIKNDFISKSNIRMFLLKTRRLIRLLLADFSFFASSTPDRFLSVRPLVYLCYKCASAASRNHSLLQSHLSILPHVFEAHHMRSASHLSVSIQKNGVLINFSYNFFKVIFFIF